MLQMKELGGQESLNDFVKVNSFVSIYLSDPNSPKITYFFPSKILFAPIVNCKCKTETILKRQLLMFYCYWLILKPIDFFFNILF